MQTSKSIIAKTLLSVYTLSILAACNLPSPKEKEADASSAATFTAQAMADKSKALEVTVQGAFALPASKIFNLQACVKDVAYDKIIAGHDFIIEETNQKVTSDKAGCVTWSEKMDFNFLSESQYIRIERHIKGSGLHKGVRPVAFAINPWSHGETLAPVLNPEDGNKIPRLANDETSAKLALKGYTTDQQLINRPLWVEDGRLFVTEQKLTSEGVELLLEMRPTVSIQMTKMNGENFLRPLTAGAFKGRTKLIHVYQQDNKEIRRLLSESKLMDIRMENGSLAIKSVMTLPARPTRGQMVLGLELIPVGGPEGLKNFDGVYLLGDFDQIKGMTFLKLNTQVAQAKEFKIADYINADLSQVAKNPTTGALEAAPYQKPKIEVSPLEIRFVRVGTETTAQREIIYNVKACVKSGLDNKNTTSHQFKVTKFRQNEGDTATTTLITTDNNSCINWDETISFKYFDCHRYLKGFVQLENKDLGMNEKLEILVNPWESQGQLGRDLRYVEPSEKLILNCQKESRPRTQLVVDGFSYHTRSYDYEMDSLLNLTVIKKIQLRMDPRLLVYSSMGEGRGDVEKLRDGIYLLRLAVVQNRDYDVKNTYVTSADKLVNVLSGQINTEITFQTQDLKALGNRNNLLVEIYPVDESKVSLNNGQISLKNPQASMTSAIDTLSGLETSTFVGPITLNTDDSSRPLNLLDPSVVSQFFIEGQKSYNATDKNIIEQVVTQGLKVKDELYKNAQQRNNKAQYSKDNNLDLISLQEAATEAPLVKALVGSTRLDSRLIATKADLQEFITKGSLTPVFAQKLCAFWASDYLKKMHPEKGGAVLQQNIMALGMDCFNSVKKNPAQFFQTEKYLLTKEIGKKNFIKGFNKGITVGTSFSVSASNSHTKTSTFSLSAKMGLSKKILDLVSVGLDAGYSVSWSTSDAVTSSNSISVTENTSMTVQRNIFKVPVHKYEQCAIVRLNPLLFVKDSKGGLFGRPNYLGIFNPRLSETEMINVTTRGLMICEGVIRETPQEITEEYYLIAQESGSSQMQDSGDSRNRNFFMALRSKNDYDRFILAIKGETKAPTGATHQEDAQNQTVQLLERLFQMPGPSHPGMYLVQ